MLPAITRRKILTALPALAIGAPLATGSARGSAALPAPTPRPADEPFGYALNTSTIRGQKLPLNKIIPLASKAGFTALEPWIGELDDHVKAGGSLDVLRAQLVENGLQVVSVIGFFDWAVDDDARRRKGLEEARRNMDLVRKVGGARLAAPPSGATDVSNIDPRRLAERYRALLEIGDKTGVAPMVEVWGFSKTITTLAEAAAVAIGADHPSASILADVYHLYKGGSGFHGLKLLGKDAMHVLHVNDYPANPPRDTITDADRVYPGDGVAPLGPIFRDLHANGFTGHLSVELFNRAYWEQDPLVVLQTALAKLRAQVKAAFANRPVAPAAPVR